MEPDPERIPLTRLEPEALRKFAADFVADRIFTDRHLQDVADIRVIGLVFLPIARGELARDDWGQARALILEEEVRQKAVESHVEEG